MKIKELIKNKAFFIGFFSGMVFLISFTIHLFFNSLCHHCVRTAGFPFVFWEQFSGTLYFSPGAEISSDNFEHFFILNLIADVLFAIIFSFIMGLFFNFIWLKLTKRGVNHK